MKEQKQKDLNKRYMVIEGEDGEQIIIKRPWKERAQATIDENPALVKIVEGVVFVLSLGGAFVIGKKVGGKKSDDNNFKILEDQSISIEEHDDGSFTVSSAPTTEEG